MSATARGKVREPHASRRRVRAGDGRLGGIGSAWRMRSLCGTRVSHWWRVEPRRSSTRRGAARERRGRRVRSRGRSRGRAVRRSGRRRGTRGPRGPRRRDPRGGHRWPCGLIAHDAARIETLVRTNVLGVLHPACAARPRRVSRLARTRLVDRGTPRATGRVRLPATKFALTASPKR